MIACQCALALFSYNRSSLASLARFLFVGQSDVHLHSLLQGMRVTYVTEMFVLLCKLDSSYFFRCTSFSFLCEYWTCVRGSVYAMYVVQTGSVTPVNRRW